MRELKFTTTAKGGQPVEIDVPGRAVQISWLDFIPDEPGELVLYDVPDRSREVSVRQGEVYVWPSRFSSLRLDTRDADAAGHVGVIRVVDDPGDLDHVKDRFSFTIENKSHYLNVKSIGANDGDAKDIGLTNISSSETVQNLDIIASNAGNDLAFFGHRLLLKYENDPNQEVERQKTAILPGETVHVTDWRSLPLVTFETQTLKHGTTGVEGVAPSDISFKRRVTVVQEEHGSNTIL
jgi:hypothetical protein